MTEADSARRPLPWWTGLAWLAVLAATLAPIFRAQFPLGVDLPNHLARAHILHRLPTDAQLATFYEPAWGILPNLAFDVIVVPLLAVAPTYMAGKLFIALALIMMFAGVALVRRQVYGRIGFLPLATALVAYNIPVATGLANFYFGAGLLMLALAAWLAMEAWSVPARLAVATVFATALFFTHMFAFGAYGFILLIMRLESLWRRRQLTLPMEITFAGQFILPGLLWLLVKSPTHGTLTYYGAPLERLFMAMSPVSYLMNIDVAIAGVLAVLLIWLVVSRRLIVPAPLAAPLIGLMLLSLAMPMVLFGVWITHVRLPLVAALLLIASADVRLPEVSLRRLVVAGLVVIALVRLEKVDGQVGRCDAHRQEFIAGLKSVPTGARILPVIDDASDVVDCMAGYYWHIPALAVIERSSFNPMMFAQMQPLDVNPALRRYLQRQPRPASPALLHGRADPVQEPAWSQAIVAGWRRDFDVLLWLHPKTRPQDVPMDVTKIGGGSFFTFYRISGGG